MCAARGGGRDMDLYVLCGVAGCVQPGAGVGIWIYTASHNLSGSNRGLSFHVGSGWADAERERCAPSVCRGGGRGTDAKGPTIPTCP